MTKDRQDAWTEENDLLLAETILRHIREGSTQLNAFEEVGDKLNRTSAACGFRWNAVVRQQYLKAIELAKKQRKQRQRAMKNTNGGKTKLLYTPPEPTISFENDQETTLQQDTDFIDSTEQQDFPAMASNEAPKQLNLDTVIHFLANMKGSTLEADHLKHQVNRLKRENAELSAKNEELEKQLKRKQKQFETVQQDYQALIQIMDRARRMVVFEDEERPANSFKMDKNGNLERIERVAE